MAPNGTILLALLAAAALSGPALGQSPPATITQAPPPGSAAPAPAATARPTLVPDPGDPVNVDEVVLPEKPVLLFSGSGGWDDALKTLKDAFARIEAELAKAGIAPAGRPVAVFTSTTDDTFKFDALVPIAAVPASLPALPPGMRFAATPAGKAYRFVHKGAYDDIDSTYETITTYLEAKDIVAKDVFLEEFVNDPKTGSDLDTEVNIYVQPK